MRRKLKLITYQITLPEPVANAIQERGSSHAPFRSRKRQTEVELCQREGIVLDEIVPLGKKGPKRKT